MSKNQKLMTEALQAVNDVFLDMSVDSDKAVSNMNEIIEEAEILRDSLSLTPPPLGHERK